MEKILQYIKSHETLAIAFFPVAAIAAALCLEYGYAAYFGYPRGLIKIDLETAIFALATCGVVAIPLALYGYVSLKAILRQPPVFGRMAHVYLVIFMMVIMILTAGNFSREIIRTFAIPFFVSIILFAAEYLNLMHEKTLKWLFALRAKRGSLPTIDPERVAAINFDLNPAKYFLTILIWTGSITYSIGYLFAMSKLEFSAFSKENATYGIVAIYNNMVIGTRIDNGAVRRGECIVLDRLEIGTTSPSKIEKSDKSKPFWSDPGSP